MPDDHAPVTMPIYMPVDSIAPLLLRHYDEHARDLPWRVLPHTCAPPPDPYAVWLSEIMLQQTTVSAVIPYFQFFIQRWPDVNALAKSEDADVMAAWAGLGYYARARNLLKCARVIAADYGGTFPCDEQTLRHLPGIGRYTAAAIMAIAFGQRAIVVDGNVERVMARLHAVTTPLPKAKAELTALAERHTPDQRAGDYAQAVMDLGATLCTPRTPQCNICPIARQCMGKKNPLLYPARLPKIPRPERVDTAYCLIHNGQLLLERRPKQGLLGGMLGLPLSAPPLAGDWQPIGQVRHIFTHFGLTLTVMQLEVDSTAKLTYTDNIWHPIPSLSSAGLPSLFRKAVLLLQENTR